MQDEAPRDLITIKEAEEISGYSRTWVLNHADQYVVAGVMKVSRSAIMDAKREHETPRLKERGSHS